MTNDIDVKTVLVLVVLIVALSVLGTTTYIASTGNIGGITGLATGTGTVRINLTGVAGVSVTDSESDLGDGYVNATMGTAAWVSSEGIHNLTWANATPTVNDSMQVENNGTIPVNVTIQSNETAHDWLGAGAALNYKAANSEANSCTGLQATYNNISNVGNAGPVCNSLKSNDASDELNVSYNVTVPANFTGEHNITVTFTALAI